MRRSSQNANSIPPPALPARGYKSPPLNPRSLAGGFVKVKAFAKINLFLDVLNKRGDGYHNIFSVMQSVDLYDELNISVTEKDFELICDAPDLKTDETNLVTKAARFLLSTYNIKHGLKIELAKKIPIGAGLAGGSTDCAAALIGINKLFHLNIPFEEMIKIGQAFGADVPFCLTGGTAITEGTGEIITPLPPLPPCFIVIACPSIHVSTAEIFNKLAIDSDKVKTLDKAKILDDLQNFHFYNIFTPVTSVLHPEISDLISQLRRLGARGAEMSGTGSSVFAYFKDEKSAVKALNIIGESVKNVFICKPVEGKGIFNE